MTHTVWITGGTRGIGRACTLAFLEKGYNVVATYARNDSAARELIDSISGRKPDIYKCDVSDYDSVCACWDFITAKYGGADILVNNAGIAQQKMFCDISRGEWDNMMDVNCGSVYNTSKCVYDYMVHRKWGRIINISSIWGIAGASCEVHYSASKAAVIGFTKALAKELGPSGITVNCVAPGVVATDMNSHMGEDDLQALREETPTGTIGTPQDIASAVVYLAGESASFVTGQVLSPNGGFVI